MSNSTDKELVLFTAADVKRTPLIDGVLPSKAVTVLSSPVGSEQNMVALDWAAHLSNGDNWCGCAVDGYSDVVYITGQDWDLLGQQLKAWEESHDGEKIDYLRFVNGSAAGVDMSVEGMDSRLIEELRFFNPDLIIFDSFSTLTSGKLTDDKEEVAKVFSRARHLVDKLDTAVLFIHHDDSFLEYVHSIITVNEHNGDFDHCDLSIKYGAAAYR